MVVMFLSEELQGGKNPLLPQVETLHPGERILVVLRNYDWIEPPSGYKAVKPDEFRPTLADGKYTVYINGARPEPLARVLGELRDHQIPFEAKGLELRPVGITHWASPSRVI